MKTIKSYSCLISGNKSKIEFLEDLLKQIEDLSLFVFNQGKSSWTFYNFKTLYHLCRKNFSSINSKILQNFIKLYQLKPGKKSPKSPINPLIYIDQNFNIEVDSSKKFSNYWLRFSRRNFPLLGKNNLKKISDFSKVKVIQIYKRNEKLYCKLTYVEEVPEIVTDPAKSTGLDFNTKRLASSNNKIYSMKRWFHRKSEHRKNKGKNNINNYTKNFVHSLANQIIKDLIFTGTEVLVLENLKDLRKSISKKNGTSKGKTLNYYINNCFPYSMLKQILEYKCLDFNILVETISPAFTSKTCSRCGSKETLRETRSRFECKDCNFQLDADLNASRNIRSRYIVSNGSPVNPTRLRLAESSYSL